LYASNMANHWPRGEKMEMPQSSPATQERAYGFEFRGSAREYFGIWIVNLLLSIVTIGIYTAWAKVRRLRYFYGNTFLDGHNFEYHAQPVQILIGRIIVIGVLLVINLLNVISPYFLLLFVPYLIALPWMLNKAIAFNARMTSYRNVRLSFHGSYWSALGIFILLPFIAILTLGLLAPVVSRMSTNYIGSRLKFGTAKFSTNAPLGALYGNFGATIAFFVIATLVIGGITLAGEIAAGVTELTFSPEATAEEIASRLEPYMLAGLVAVYAVIFLAAIFYIAGVRNIAFNATRLEGGHRFVSHVSRLRYVWILVSNLILTVLSLSLLRPWAAVRTWRYLAAATAVVTTGNLGHFVDEAMPQGNVAAAEYFDIEGIDFGL
jgi:uncharacterized membrane protein YjgN (DUF898 family)